MDEAGLFYQMLPNFSYCLSSEKETHGTKQKKERVTIIFCCNMTGTHKLPLALIGSSERPNCFRGCSDIPFTYLSSRSAWINTSLFNIWFRNVFLLNVRKRTSEPILLLPDGCSSHFSVKANGVTTIFIPPNVTSRSQPLDQGIISIIKRKYRKNMLRRLVEGKKQEDFIEYHNQSRKKYGFIYDGLLDILDTMKLLKEVWDTISSSTIMKFWIRSNILLPQTVASIQSESDIQEKKKIEDDDDDDIIHNLSSDFLKILSVGSSIQITQVQASKQLKKKKRT